MAMRRVWLGMLTSCLCLSGSIEVVAGEGRFPMPARFSESVIVGRTLRNPFAGKLRLGQAKVEDFMLGKVHKSEEISATASIGPIVYYNTRSLQNRALVDGRVRRPGDRFALRDGSPALVVEVKRRSVVLEILKDGRKEQIERMQDRRKKRSV